MTGLLVFEGGTDTAHTRHRARVARDGVPVGADEDWCCGTTELNVTAQWPYARSKGKLWRFCLRGK